MKLFTLAEIREFAETIPHCTADDVVITPEYLCDYETGEMILDGYEVVIDDGFTARIWTFDDLDAPAVDYVVDHWED